MPVSDLEFLSYQHAEHEAWLAVGREFKKLGLDMNVGVMPEDRGNAVDLHDAIVRWGEELAQLRMADPAPEHAANALAERRAAYPLPD